MTSSIRIHGKFSCGDQSVKVRQLAERVLVKVQIFGTRQVRLHKGMLLTYPYPVRRGYGVRGLLVGIYTVNTQLEWLEDDVRGALSDSLHCNANPVAVSTCNP